MIEPSRFIGYVLNAILSVLSYIKLFFNIFFLLPFLFLCLCQNVNAEDMDIGMSAAFRGPTAGLGIELYRGSMAYIEYINGLGGVHGKKITIKAYDDGYNPIPAIENTIRLIEKDKVFLLFNYVGTPTVTRILPIFKPPFDYFSYQYSDCVHTCEPSIPAAE